MKKSLCILFLSCCIAFLVSCSDSSNNTSTQTSYVQTIAETKTLIESQMTEKSIVGLSIALVDAEREPESRLIWAQGFGMADKEIGKQASANTIYCIGSTSKLITAVALLKQKDAGHIDLDQPVQSYIPNFSLQIRYPDIGQNNRITPRTLLNMHAGVPGDLYNGLFLRFPHWYGKYMTWLLSFLQTDYPSHPPGTLASYGNIGIVLAGHAAYLAGREKGDRDFQAFVKRTVFDPLGMDSTMSEVVGKDIPNLAIPYNKGDSEVLFDTNGTATGGFYSTVKDMSKFITMLLADGVLEDQERFLNSDTVREIGKGHKTELDTNSYYQPGLGLDSVNLPAFYGVAPYQGDYGRAWAKNGSDGRYNAMIMLLPDTGLKLGVVVLSNSDTAETAVYAVARTSLLAAVREKLGLSQNPEPKPLPNFSRTAITEYSKIVGLYGTHSPSAYFKIELRDGELFWVTDPYKDETAGHALSLKPDGSNAFAVEEEVWNVVFIDRRDIDGTDYRFMVRAGGESEAIGPNVVSTIGQKITTSGELAQAWQDRVDRMYVADLMIQFSIDPYVTFRYRDGLLLAQTPSGMHAVYPHNDNLAFVGDTMSRGDGTITVTSDENSEKLYYLTSEYFPIDRVSGYTLGDEEPFELQLRNDIPLSVWRKFTVTQGSKFDGKDIRFAVTPGDDQDVYFVYGENLNTLGSGLGKDGAILKLDAGTYYFAFSPAVNSSGEKTLTSNIVY